MRLSQKPTIIGKYAIYFHSLSDAITEHRRAFFGSNRARSLDLHNLPHFRNKKEGKLEPKVNKASSPETGLEKLEDAVERAQNILVKSSSVFPFELFPDSITIDRQKLTVVHRDFFSTKQTASVQYSDIKNIQADVGPFLGSLTVTSEHFVNNTQTIKFLPKSEVLAIQQLVQGFIIANNEHVDMRDIEDKKLVELLSELGRGEAGE